MKILLVSPYFPPQNAVASLRTHAFATHWAKAGHDITVLTTEKRDDQRGLSVPINGFAVVEVPFGVPRLLEGLRGRHKADANTVMPPAGVSSRRAPLFDMLRRWKESTGVFSSVRKPDLTDHWIRPALAWARPQPTWDVVVSSSGPYTAHLVAMRLKRDGRAKKWIADFRDLWTDNHLHRGLFPFTLLERRLERQCLREAGLLTTVSEGLAQTLRSKSRIPVEVIYNGFDPEAFDALPAERIFARDDIARLVYTGTLYPQGQDVTPLLQALALIKSDRGEVASRLRLVIAGQNGTGWLDAARALGVADLLDMRGVVSRDDSLRMQRDADALVLLDWNDPRQGVLTGKVFEYLNATAPILVLGSEDGSPIAQLVKQSRRGMCFEHDIPEIAQSLIALIERPQRFDVSGDRSFISTLSRQRQSAHMLALIQAIATTQS